MAKKAAFVDRDGAAEILGFSSREVEERDRRCLMPRSFRIEGKDMWRRTELVAWVQKGIPDRQTWEEKTYDRDWDSQGSASD